MSAISSASRPTASCTLPPVDASGLELGEVALRVHLDGDDGVYFSQEVELQLEVLVGLAESSGLAGGEEHCVRLGLTCTLLP